MVPNNLAMPHRTRRAARSPRAAWASPQQSGTRSLSTAILRGCGLWFACATANGVAETSEEFVNLGSVKHFLFQQHRGHPVQNFQVRAQQTFGTLVSIPQDSSD